MTGGAREPLRRRALLVAAVVVAVGAAAGSLVAYFSGSATAGSAGGAAATSVNAAAAPVAVANPGRSVTLTWSAVTLANGQPVDGYLVTRWEAAPPYAPALTTAGGCSGTVAALTCTEYGVPFGSWRYTITPVIGANWHGPASPDSGTVIIGAASLSLAPATLGLADFGGGSSPATLTGALTGFASNEGITFKLDDPSSGTTLSGSPARADGNGEASISVSLPRPGDGAHSVYAIGDAGYPSQASASILVDTTAPTSSASGADSSWHSADVAVSLSADDGAGGTGVATIKYQIDSGPLHTISGAGGAVTIQAPSDGSNDGVHTIAFYATDNAGNVEAPAKQVTVKIDTTRPSTSLTTIPSSPDGTNNWFRQSSVDVMLSASDAGGSGVASTFYRVDGGAPQTYSGTVTINTQGDHTVEFWSVDNAVPAANVESHTTVHVKLDSVKPLTTITVDPASPDGSNGWYVSTPSFTLSASDATSDVDLTKYAIDGGSEQTYSGAVSIPDGQHTITYWSVDKAGNEETHHTSATIKVDTAKPSTSITLAPASPDGSDGWRVSATTFTLSASDASSGVAATRYQIDNGATNAYTGNPVSIPQGSHTVTYWSVDNAGNTESSTTTGTIKVDTVKPSTTIAIAPASPDGSNGWRVSATSFTLSALDATSGVGSTKYQLDGGAIQTYSGAVPIPDGQHTVTYWSVDNAGNTEDSTTTATIKVDTVKPSTSITLNPASPDGSNDWRVSATSFTLNAADATSGVASTKYQIDAGAVKTYSGAVSLPEGQHTVTYWSVDDAGNTESSTATGAIKVDTTNPSTTFATTPATADGSNGWFKRSSVTFTLTGADATSGIDHSYYKLDGGSQQTYGGAVTVNTQGDHTVEYWSVDKAGNVEASATTHVKLDNVAPSLGLSLTAPTGGATLAASLSGSTLFFDDCNSNGGFRLQSTVADATSGAASALYPALSASRWTTHATETITTPSGGPYVSSSFLWSASNCGGGRAATPGSYTVTAADAAGNTSTATIGFTADDTDPSAALTHPASGTDYSATTWNAGCSSTICGSSSDTGGSGVQKVEVSIRRGSGNYWNGSSFSSASQVWNQAAGTTSWTYAFPASSFPADGSYTVSARSTDNVGNQSSAASRTFTFDSTAPTGSITAPAPNSLVRGSSVTVTSSSADSGTGVDSARFQRSPHDAGTWTDIGTDSSSFGGWSVSWNTTSLADGQYDLRVVTTDDVGNTSTSATVTVTVDNTAPGVNGVVLGNGGTSGRADDGDTVTITFDEALDASTICSGWSPSGSQSTTATVSISSGDVITLGSAACGTFHLASVALNANYNGSSSSTRSYSGSSVAWNAGSRTLTITLNGNGSGGTQSTGVPTSTPSYTADSAIKDLAGNAIAAGPYVGSSSRF